MSSSPPSVNAFWVGPALGPIHAACLRSFVRAGHKVMLHCYERPADLPTSIEEFDARQLMPESRIIRYRRSGSPALGSDIYRYAMMKAGMGLYVDCDVYCVRPIPDDDFIFGLMANDMINGAVLKLPADSPLLTDLMTASNDPYFIPPWFDPWQRRRLRLKRAVGFGKRTERLQWGTLGPRAITWYVDRHGLRNRAAPVDVFYPLFGAQRSLLGVPGLTIADLVTPRTLAIHLVGSSLAKYVVEPPPSSPLGQMISGS